MLSARACQRLAIAGVATALVAGCGSSSKGGSGAVLNPSGAPKGGAGGGSIQELLAGSVDKADEAKNAKIHLDFTGSAAGKDLSFGGDGVADFAGKKFEMTLNLPAAAGISGSIEELVIGNQLYLKLPASEAAVTGGKPWIKVDASELGSSSTSGLSFTNEDPTQLLNTLRGVSSSVTKLGTADVRGVQTTHYRAEVDLAKAVQASGADSSAMQQFTKTLGAATIPEDVYLDSAGLPRRFAITIKPSSLLPSDAPSAAASAAAGSSFTVTVDLYDFGQADTSGITAPPADQVGDLGSLLGGSATPG